MSIQIKFLNSFDISIKNVILRLLKNRNTFMKYFSIVLILFLTYCSSGKLEDTSQSGKSDKDISDRKRAASELFIKGNTSEMKGQLAEAILDYIEASKLDPQPGIFYSIGKNYYILNKMPAAIRNLKTAVEMDPQEIEYKMLLAEVYSAAFLADSAAIIYENVLTQDSLNSNAIYNLASLYEFKKPLRALELFNKLIELNGPDWQVLLKIASINEQTGDADATIKTLKSLTALNPSLTDLQKMLIEKLLENDRLNEADSIINESIMVYPDDINFTEYKAMILFRQDKPKEAKAEYIKIVNDKNVDLNAKIKIGTMFLVYSSKDSSAIQHAKDIFTEISKDTSDWQVFMYLGEICIFEKDDSCAINNFKKVTELNGTKPEFWFRLGGLLFDNKRYSEAIVEMSEAVQIFPDEFPINMILGLSNLQESNFIEAEQYLEKAIKLNPNDNNSLFAYAFALNSLNKKDEAVVYLLKSLELNNENIQALGMLGSIYSDKKEYEKSDEYYEKALKIDPEDILILNNYAYSLSVRGVQLERALEMVSKSVEKEPKNASYLDTMGWVYFKLKKYDDALELINRAYEIEKENPEIIEHLGDIYFEKGEKEKALDNWKKSLEIKKDNRDLENKIKNEAL